MAYQDFNSRPQRQMFDVSAMGITCTDCGAAITELPFEPTKKEDGTYGTLRCYECNKKKAPARGGLRPQRQMFNISSMNIKCSGCDAPINELPFEPTEKEDGTYGKLYCYECNKQRRDRA